MRILLAGFAFALGVAGTEVPATAAQPVCLSTLPFQNVFVWFVDLQGGDQLRGTGVDLSGNRPQSVSVHVTGDTASVGFITYPAGAAVPVIGAGTIAISTGDGPGRCFSPDLASCGEFTFALIECPVSAPAGAAAAEALTTAGPAMGLSP
ncbi:MAG TPA: hypothetical protein VMT79_17565 [Candidatus Binatia bacterium]|nr:hypothetical protein [Candidatus Binatia bacterium]